MRVASFDSEHRRRDFSNSWFGITSVIATLVAFVVIAAGGDWGPAAFVFVLFIVCVVAVERASRVDKGPPKRPTADLPQVSGHGYRLAAVAFVVFAVLQFVWIAGALVWLGLCVMLFGMWSLRHPDGALVQTRNGPMGDAVAGGRRTVQPVIAVVACLLGVLLAVEGVHTAGAF